MLLEPEPAQEEGVEGQGSVQMTDNQINSPRVAPSRPKKLQAPTPPSVAMPEKGAPLPIGTAVLRDRTGKELNMDGTPKVPYRHPHYGQNKEKEHLQNIQRDVVQLEEIQEDDGAENYYRKRNVLTVKPAKLNISEFEGQDPES